MNPSDKKVLRQSRLFHTLSTDIGDIDFEPAASLLLMI